MKLKKERQQIKDLNDVTGDKMEGKDLGDDDDLIEKESEASSGKE